MDPREELVAQTIRRHMHPEAHIVRIATTSMRADEHGYSGARLARHLVTFSAPAGAIETTTLITKESSLIERRVLACLLEQGQCVPFSHMLDVTTDAPALICQQDLGDSAAQALAPAEVQRKMARCLARIHHANLGRGTELDWLPRADRAYGADVILADFREQLARARERPSFMAQCGDVARQMEEAIEPFLASMDTLWAAADTRTLIHADLMDTHVLVRGGQPYLIDWRQARYGSFYLDLPNYFTPSTVLFYREALDALGIDIPEAEFAQRYHEAGRYPGFKYMGFLLHFWSIGQLNSLQGPLLQQLLAGSPTPGSQLPGV